LGFIFIDDHLVQFEIIYRCYGYHGLGVVLVKSFGNGLGAVAVQNVQSLDFSFTIFIQRIGHKKISYFNDTISLHKIK